MLFKLRSLISILSKTTVIVLTALLVISSFATVVFAEEEEDEVSVVYTKEARELENVKAPEIYIKEANVLTEIDLDYWFQDLYTEKYGSAIINAMSRVGFPGIGYCATWVGNVYRAAGLGYVQGNANDMWRVVCNSTNAAEIEEGMIIAVKYSGLSDLGMVYGHCGILIQNPSYEGTDLLEKTEPLYRRVYYLEPILEKNVSQNDKKEIRAELRELKEELKPYEAIDTDNYYYVNGRLIQTDSNGHEKWLVVDSTDSVGVSTLSTWLRNVDIYSTAAWGWGHQYYGIVTWLRNLG